MTKVSIKRLDSITKNDTTATEQINSNFLALQEAIENTLSRDGTGPNFMDADLDMNSYRIINSADPVEDLDIVNKKYVEEKIGAATEASKVAVNAAAQAATSAQSALVSSTNAINTLRNAEEQLNNTITYVDEAKESIDEAITAATDEVKQKALDAANEAINDAAATATAIVVDYANNEIKPLLNEIASNAAESAENASESAGLAANESGNAAISATDSQHYAEDSRIWAEGSDSEVKNVDGEHSSKVWSEMAKTSATSAASSAELAKQYGNDKINQTHITNCITEIPQDIKLELKNGTLILKAGSKVYVPNGAGKFDAVMIESDKTVSYGHDNIDIVWYRGDDIALLPINLVYSGSTAPSGSQYMLWYDTTNNQIKFTSDSGASWLAEQSLPLGVIATSSSAPTSIDQVFNGFGYIGSTVFALPSVKGLIPNGRNADGSLKNIEFTVDKVITRTITWNNAAGQELFIGKYNLYEGIQFISTGHINTYFQQDAEPTKVKYAIWYKPSENKVYRCDSDSNSNLIWKDNFPCYIGQWFTSGTSPYPITELTTKLPFRAADEQDVILKQDKATAVNYDNITNCITEIPQDIKLENNNGTVILKAGSKVYIPKGKDSSGNNIFSEYTTSSDLSFGASSLGSAKRFVALLSGNIQIGAWSAFTSGTTVPSTGYFYHTSENRMYVNGEVVNLSLPLMFGDYVTQSGFSSIDQVFNGFGYVGNTVFALPGVKGLIPDGRNADGSLKNIETTVNKVAVYTFASNVYTPHNGRFLLNSSGGIFARVGGYDPVRNYITASDGVNILSGCSFAEGCLVEAGVIKTFNSKLPFRAVDTNDSTWARSKSFPDYTAAISISATGSYTAPCDGVLIGSVTAINGGSELTITIGGTNFICYQGNSGNDYNHTTQTYFPLKAGQGYTVDKLSGTTLRFFPFA